MKPRLRGAPVLILLAVGSALAGTTASASAEEEIPYWARKYDVPCSTCHVQPPKLNAAGEAFRNRGYRLPDARSRGTVPLAIWASARSDAFPDEAEVRDAVRGYINKLEVISGGQAFVPWLSYFVEWRPVSLEAQGRDGAVQLRDRSGRFEDLFVTATAGRLAVTVGQFRQIDQVDVSLRLGLSEPLSLSASIPGSGGSTPRRQSLRAFSPAGRSPSVRVGWDQPVRSGWTWTSSVALPVGGELSIPLTSEARVEASNEIDWRPKGLFLESFARRGLHSFGAHAFYRGPDRLLVQGVTTFQRSGFHGTAVAGVERAPGLSRGRWSVEGEFLPSYWLALGARLEDRAADGAPAAFLPFARTHFPGTRRTFYLALEQRVQRGRNATLLELGAVF